MLDKIILSSIAATWLVLTILALFSGLEFHAKVTVVAVLVPLFTGVYVVYLERFSKGNKHG